MNIIARIRPNFPLVTALPDDLSPVEFSFAKSVLGLDKEELFVALDEETWHQLSHLHDYLKVEETAENMPDTFIEYLCMAGRCVNKSRETIALRSLILASLKTFCKSQRLHNTILAEEQSKAFVTQCEHSWKKHGVVLTSWRYVDESRLGRTSTGTSDRFRMQIDLNILFKGVEALLLIRLFAFRVFQYPVDFL